MPYKKPTLKVGDMIKVVADYGIYHPIEDDDRTIKGCIGMITEISGGQFPYIVKILIEGKVIIYSLEVKEVVKYIGYFAQEELKIIKRTIVEDAI